MIPAWPAFALIVVVLGIIYGLVWNFRWLPPLYNARSVRELLELEEDDEANHQ